MPLALFYVTVVVIALCAAYALTLTVLDRRVDDRMFWLMVALELVLLVLAGAGIVALIGGEAADPGSLIAYLITVVVLAPVALLWGIAEKSRWGSGVLCVGLATVAVLVARIDQLWPGVA